MPRDEGDRICAKRAMRVQVRASRASRNRVPDAEVGALLVHRLAQVSEVARALATRSTIAASLPFGSEPDVGPFLAAVRSSGAALLLPAIDGLQLRWMRADSDGPLVDEAATVAAGGIPQPRGALWTGPLGEVAVVVLPALAAGLDGIRLGRGRGFYDRALEGLPSHVEGGPLRVAVVHDDEVFDAGVVPREPHDLPVDVVVTPQRTLRVTP